MLATKLLQILVHDLLLGPLVVILGLFQLEEGRVPRAQHIYFITLPSTARYFNVCYTGLYTHLEHEVVYFLGQSGPTQLIILLLGVLFFLHSLLDDGFLVKCTISLGLLKLILIDFRLG